VLRILVLLFAVVMMAAGAVQLVHASPDVVAAVDDDDGPGTPTPVEPAVVVVRDEPAMAVAVPRAPPPGRSHIALVFRPPRAFASR
jgi:hypothetical protein